jgi:hypothetical protein
MWTVSWASASCALISSPTVSSRLVGTSVVAHRVLASLEPMQSVLSAVTGRAGSKCLSRDGQSIMDYDPKGKPVAILHQLIPPN